MHASAYEYTTLVLKNTKILLNLASFQTQYYQAQFAGALQFTDCISTER